MKNIEFFSLNFCNMIITANISTTFFFFEIDVFNFSMIDTNEIKSVSEIDVVISIKINTIEIKKIFKYTIFMLLSKINEIFYFQRQNVSNFLNRFNFICKNYEFFEIDKIKRFL